MENFALHILSRTLLRRYWSNLVLGESLTRQLLFTECRRLKVVHIPIDFDSGQHRSSVIAKARSACPELYDLELGQSSCSSSDSESEFIV